MRWMQFEFEEVNAFHREDAFLARISYEIYLLRYTVAHLFDKTKPPKPDQEFKDFLIKFEKKEVEEDYVEAQARQRRELIDVGARTERSMSAWCGFLGVDRRTGEVATRQPQRKKQNLPRILSAAQKPKE